MIYYLYVKTHNQTGMKYLGKTKSDNPYSYKGSGLYWLRHLKKHGNNVSTNLIAAVDTIDDLKVAGKFWSQHWNVVQSNEWANLIPENGIDGGGIKGPKPEGFGKKLSLYWTGRSKPRSQVEKMRQSKTGITPNDSPEAKLAKRKGATKSGLAAVQNKTGIHAQTKERHMEVSLKAKNNFLQKCKIPEFKELHSMKIRFGRLRKRFDRLPHPAHETFGFDPF